MQIQCLLEDGGGLQAGGLLFCGEPFQTEKLVLIKAAGYNICVSDIYGKNHLPFLRDKNSMPLPAYF